MVLHICFWANKVEIMPGLREVKFILWDGPMPLKVDQLHLPCRRAYQSSERHLDLLKSTCCTHRNCLFKTSNPAGSCLSHCKGPGVADSFLFPDWMVHYFRRKIEPTSSALTRWRYYLRRVSFLILLLTFKRVLWTLLPKITFRTDAASRLLSLEVKDHKVCCISRHCESDTWMFRLIRAPLSPGIITHI